MTEQRRLTQPIIHVDNLRGAKVADIRQVPWQQSSTSLPAAGSWDDITALPECTKAQNRHPLGKADPGSSTCPSESLTLRNTLAKLLLVRCCVFFFFFSYIGIKKTLRLFPQIIKAAPPSRVATYGQLWLAHVS